MEFGGGDEYEVGVAKRIAAEHTCTKLPQCMPTCPLMRHLVSKFHHRDILPPQHQAQGGKAIKSPQSSDNTQQKYISYTKPLELRL